MLGRLKMSLDSAIDHFATLATDVFSDKKYISTSGSGAFKSTKMQQALKSIIRAATGYEDEKMRGDYPEAEICRT